MDELPLKLRTFLSEAAQRLHDARLPKELGEAMERLSGQVDQPCVVAVVGRMKAGKSTFINALLGEDLAKVGATETTATINYFRYGRSNHARPVRCYWQNGSITEEDRSFVDRLQGNDVETLRRASGIRYLEYHLLNPYLERVTLVDTPGTSAVVDEHVQRTAEFLALERQLRERHNAETERLGNEADAVIYLVGQIARASDQAFLEEFQNATGGRSKALNAVGVLAKIDLHAEILQRRHKLAEKIGTQLKDTLNTVVPVSAGIHRAMDRLCNGGSSGIADFLAPLQRIPARQLEKLLDSEEFYREIEADNCPVTVTERTQLLGDMPWAVFTALVRAGTALAFDPAATAAEWRSLSGFDRLRDLLDRHFVRRSQFLRCYRIVNDVRRLLDDIRFKRLPKQRQRDREWRDQLNRFIGFVRGSPGDPTVATELEDFIKEHSSHPMSTESIEATWKSIGRCLAEFTHDLEEWNSDFGALVFLDHNTEMFTPADLDELRALFGLYGTESAQRIQILETNHISSRQQHWLKINQLDAHEGRRQIAERAVDCLGHLLQVVILKDE